MFPGRASKPEAEQAREGVGRECCRVQVKEKQTYTKGTNVRGSKA